MSEPAKEMSDKATDTAGLEHVFAEENSIEQSENFQTSSKKSESIEGILVEQPSIKSEHSDESDIEDVEAAIQVSMAEAARRLDMPYPTLRRHVLQGKIPSVTDEDGKRQVLLEPGDYSDELVESSGENSNSSSDTKEFSETIQLLIDELRDSHQYNRQLSQRMLDLNGQNGYLQGKLESQENEIKLLTDRSSESESEEKFNEVISENEKLKSHLEQLQKELEISKRSSWGKFWNWMIGRKD